MIGKNILPRSSWIGFLALLASFGITSCATVKPAATTAQAQTGQAKPETWEQRTKTLAAIKSWQINGKIAVHTPNDAGSATIDWQQQHQHFLISLTGPLGSHNLKLTGEPGLVTADSADGKHASASSAEQLLAQQWGFKVPVSNLNYWVRGLPVPGTASRTHFDASGNKLDQLEQQGWLVQFLSYKQVRGIDLPDKIFISSPSLKVRMMIYQWQIG